jgi:hypothetical protein
VLYGNVKKDIYGVGGGQPQAGKHLLGLLFEIVRHPYMQITRSVHDYHLRV